jgi:putative ABC transport system permease protein
LKHHPLVDLDGEIRDHIARETEDNIAKGMTPADAHLAARRTFGSVALAEEHAREVWIPRWLDQVRQDIHYGLRTLGRNPGFATVIILTLAVGIGLTTAVFSVVNAVLLRPLPYADGDRIVLVRETLRQIGNASVGHFYDWTEHSTVFEHTAAGQGVTFNLADEGDPERIRGMRVTPGYFQVAYLPPAIGHYFTQQEVDASARVVVLSHSLWQSRFGSDRAIVGRQIRLDGEQFVIVGVAPAAFALTDPARAGVTGGFSSQMWTPLTFTPEQRVNFGSHYLGVLAKLKSGVTLAQAQGDLERVTRGIAERHPQEMIGRGVMLQSVQEQLVGNARTQLLALSAAAAFVLLIGCVNIAGLLVCRATSRRREIAIRSSLGGGRPRIVRQLLTESAILAFAGGLTSLLVAATTIEFFKTNGPEMLPRLREAGLQVEVLLFTLGITGGAALLFGLAPAVRAARTDLQRALRDGGKTFSGMGRDRLRTIMVVTETAITVVLLIGTGLLMRSADKLRQVPLGFNGHDVITARVSLPEARYGSDQTVAEAYGRMLAPLRGTNGIRHAAASTHIPLVGSNADSTTIAEGRTYAPGSEPSPMIRLVTDEYFEAMGMTIASGRSVQAIDVAPGSPRVVVINEQLAAALWPGENPVSRRLSTWSGRDNPEWREVVGVVRDARSVGQRFPVPMELFIPYTQAPLGAWDAFQRSMALVVRSGENWPETYMPAIRQAVRDTDSSVPLYDVRTMEGVVVAVTASRRFYMRLVLMLGATGLFLAMLGIYGVIAYFVSQRTPEIGLRLAVGAGRPDVVRMVVRQALRVAMVGLIIGVPSALLFTDMMNALLYEIEPTDPLTFAGAALIVLATSLLASLIPSVRAARVDPLVALRHE